MATKSDFGKVIAGNLVVQGTAMPPVAPNLRRDRQLERTAASRQGRYGELELRTERPPLELAIAIISRLDETRYTLYENGDRIVVGIGAMRTLSVDANGIVHCDGAPQEDSGGLAATLAETMAQLPFEGWRAYGRIAFECADGLRGATPSALAGALLRLAVPSAEICLQGDRLLLRCFDGGRLLELAHLMGALERAPDLLPASFPVVAQDCEESAAAYLASVTVATAEMHGRDYNKIVLSRRVPLPETVDLPLSYHAGRASNTPLRSFLLRDGDFAAYGYSPETLLEVDTRGWFETQPVAGTRRLTGDPHEDRRLREDLLRDPKEIAEHAISVHLAMEEMRPLCEEGSLAIDRFMEIVARGSVQHLASRIGGKLGDGVGAWDALLALFPAVTVSGVPKATALDAIRRHEPRPRGLYGGCVFTIDASGEMDAAVALRSVFRQGRECWCQVGAGILPMSVAERELEETREKVASVMRNLRQAVT